MLSHDALPKIIVLYVNCSRSNSKSSYTLKGLNYKLAQAFFNRPIIPSTANMNSNGDSGSPWRKPRLV